MLSCPSSLFVTIFPTCWGQWARLCHMIVTWSLYSYLTDEDDGVSENVLGFATQFLSVLKVLIMIDTSFLQWYSIYFIINIIFILFL